MNRCDNRGHAHDFYAWANEQAALLRAGKLAAADIENIAEEIESMGRTEKRELVSRLTILLLHLLKWQFQPTHRGHSWRMSIANARDDITDHLADNPSLHSHLVNAISSAYRRARRQASAETGHPENLFPDICPWSFEQMIDHDFWPGSEILKE
ncbi:MAG: DUF29 domain-containing protein [Magnetococcus sp. DMHC-1]|nr:DUF29 domain-containing protein [Magnetococcales bacterium]